MTLCVCDDHYHTMVFFRQNRHVHLYAIRLPQIVGETLPYDEISEVRERLGEIAPNLLQYDDLQPANFFALAEKLMKVRNAFLYSKMCRTVLALSLNVGWPRTFVVHVYIITV
jgi:hypothetical protein